MENSKGLGLCRRPARGSHPILECAPFFRPVGARYAYTVNPRLTPWAKSFRRFAAGRLDSAGGSTFWIKTLSLSVKISPPPARGRLLPLQRTDAAGSQTFPPEYSWERTESSCSDRGLLHCSNGARSESCPRSG